MTQELARREPITISPAEVASNAAEQAKVLMDIVDKTECFQIIAGKKYLQVEAWETIGAFNRVHAVTEWINPITRDGTLVGYDAKVNLVDANDTIVGSAIMPCYFTENACKGKEGDAKDKACKSAAQTFATSKAYRMNYSYVAILAGYQPTPAEEMGGTATESTTDHFCFTHKTNFFKKGRMKRYAHKIAGTDEWCNEGDDKPVAEESLNKTAEKIGDSEKRQAPIAQTEDTGLDMDWLRENMKLIKWDNVTIISWLGKFGVDKTGELEDIIARLNQEQKEELVKEINDRLEMR